MTQLTDSQKTELARQKVQEMTGFYIHAAFFALVMLILFVWAWMSPESGNRSAAKT